jgi:hypothetical protein
MPKFKDPNVWFQHALQVTEDPAASGRLKFGGRQKKYRR